MKLLLLLAGLPSLLLAQGLTNDDARYTSLPQKRLGQAVLPSRVDLSAYVPDVIDQGKFNTCVGVSVGYYLRTILEAKRRGITNKAAINGLRFSPAYLYNQIKDANDADCVLGAEISRALDYLKKNGLPTLTQQPYPACQTTTLPSRPDSRLLDYVRLFALADVPDDKVAATRKALAEQSPVVIGVQTTPSIRDLAFRNSLFSRIKTGLGQSASQADFSRWQPSKSTSLGFGHAMCVVGYDDAMFEEGAFKVVNSWGSSWGDKGYFWISYADFGQYAKYGFQAYVPPVTNPGSIVLSADLTISLGTFVTGTAVDVDRSRIGTKLMAYTVRQPQRTGTPFSFSADVSKQTYLYLITVNAADSVAVKLFPESGFSPLIGPNTHMDLPNDRLLRLDRYTGLEYWLFLFSERAIDVDSYVRRINAQKGPFPDRVLAAFGPALVPYQQVNYKDKKMGFFLKSQHRGQIVPLLVSMKHIP
ncbi:peptidase C1A papain [Fibrella aestuarina BUZ 2]|uniref:Peptidase C1A papain n=1 Tax=Fibrella aestuarina BUZ 2 TaxID=1166018 RepID=I0KFI6_9BACT|nr:C1 family peptidase [Fibrella aestuarina]CCH02889.1 peptidase C1A papain [Fibrella aestuarina BUZ 2]